MARCMLYSKGLHKRFWVEAIFCANYILNRVPNKTAFLVTPKEKWNGRKPDISNFRVFGSECWVHIYDKQWKTLDPKSHKCIFIVYSEYSKSYRLFDPSTQGVIISRDIQFHELSHPPESVEPHVTLDLPPYIVTHVTITPITVTTISNTPSSSFVTYHVLSSPTSSSNPHDSFEDTSVVPSTQILPVWARKTLESVGNEIGITYDTHRTRSEFALMTKVLATYDLTSYVKAKDKPEWEQDMTIEYNSLIKNNTWTLFPFPPRKNLVGCKWLYKKKFTSDGQIEKHKAILVVKGFSQQEGIDYNETFAHVAKMDTIITIISLVASYKWEIHQMDVKSSFLNGNLSEEIYMQ